MTLGLTGLRDLFPPSGKGQWWPEQAVLLRRRSRLGAGRPAESFARRVVPDYPEVPAAMPADW
jgi:hypothetical protein